MALETQTFADRVAAVEARIGQALERSGRQRAEILLVAVSKKFSAPHIVEAYGAGLREFGENYVQEFAEKKPGVAELDGLRFHLIGHLQTNKAQTAVQLFDVVETADSPKLLERLEKAAAQQERSLEVLLEVKLSDESAKTGADAAAIPELLRTAERCPHLQVSGLMTVPPWSEDPESSRPYFQKLSRMAHEYGLPKLSMGMSGDFEVAIEEGATIIRVGTALFGARPKPAAALPAKSGR